ncbi:HEAT repeat domain-containing protein [Candidatus Riflebacteria bacterium]
MDKKHEDLKFILKNPDKEVRNQALKELLQTPEPDLVPTLISLLAHPYWPTRKLASQVLQKYGKKVLKPLHEALETDNEDVQYWAIKILKTIPGQSIKKQIKLLDSGKENVRSLVVDALGENPCEESIKALINCFKDRNWIVRSAASQSLSKIGPTTLPYLEKALASEDANTSYWAIQTLGKIGHGACEILLKALKKGTQEQRFIIAAALGESGEKRVIGLLIDTLKDRSWVVRKNAEESLARIGKNAIEPLYKALTKKDEGIVRGAINCLLSIGGNAFDKLMDFMLKVSQLHRTFLKEQIIENADKSMDDLIRGMDSDNTEIKLFCAMILGEIGDIRSVEALIESLDHPSWIVRKNSTLALGKIGAKTLPKLRDSMDSGSDDKRFWITKVMENLGKEGVSALCRALGDRDKQIRYFAAAALGNTPTDEAVYPLIKALGDPCWTVRKKASESLIKLGEISVPTLVRHIQNENEDIRYWVEKILKSIGSSNINQINMLLKAGNREERMFAAIALGCVGDKRGSRSLLMGLDDDHSWVRHFCALSLAKLGDQRAIPNLLEALMEKNQDLTDRTRKMLQKFPDEVQKNLDDWLDSDSPTKISIALSLIGEFGHEKDSEKIIKYLPHKNPFIAFEAFNAVSQIFGFKTMDYLNIMQKHPRANVREKSYKLFFQKASKACIINWLKHLDHLPFQNDSSVIQSCLENQECFEIPELLSLLTDARSSIFKKTVIKMLKKEKKDLGEFLGPLLASPDEKIRFIAKELCRDDKKS